MSEQIKLHRGQSEIFKDLFVEKSCRYAVAVCSRGFGKSVLGAVSAIQAISELTNLPPTVPNKLVVLVAPSYSQVVDIYHPLIAYTFGMEKYCLKHSKDSGRFWFPNNTELRLVSYEAIERLRGTGVYFAVLDEVSSWTKGIGLQEAWQSVLQPCINTRWSPQRAKELGAPNPGRALTISTPYGYNFLYDMFNYRDVDPDWKSYHFDYTTSPYLDATEIEKVKHTIDPLKFAREYMATFEDSGANVFYCFDRNKHVDKTLPDFKEKEDVHVAIDFNVGKLYADFKSGELLETLIMRQSAAELKELFLMKVQRLSRKGVHLSKWKHRKPKG